MAFLSLSEQLRADLAGFTEKRLVFIGRIAEMQEKYF